MNPDNQRGDRHTVGKAFTPLDPTKQAMVDSLYFNIVQKFEEKLAALKRQLEAQRNEDTNAMWERCTVRIQEAGKRLESNLEKELETQRTMLEASGERLMVWTREDLICR